MNSKLPPAVVLTGQLARGQNPLSLNEIALTLSRSLGRHGVPVFRFHPDRDLIEMHSRYNEHVLCPNMHEDEIGTVKFLTAFADSQKSRPVLFPGDDASAEFVSLHEPALAEHFAVVCAPGSCVREIQDKQLLLERADKNGVPIPVTYFPKSFEEIERIAFSLEYPAVIKPLTSHHWRMAEVVAVLGRIKAIVVKGPDELAQSYRRIAPLTPAIMVQEIIPGETDRLLTFLGCCGQDGTVLAGCVRKKLRQYPLGFGYCCLTEMVRDPEIMDLSVRLLETLKYRGIASVEFKRDPRDGRPKLIEINARAVRTTSAAVGAGVDLPWIAYQDAIGSPPPVPVFDYAVPMRWIHLRSEIKAALSLMRSGELTLKQWLRVFKGPFVEAVWAWDDLRPSVLNLALPALNKVGRSWNSVFRRKPRQQDWDKSQARIRMQQSLSVNSHKERTRE